MNSTFKVVWNRARGALMVVNEATSSVQAKGTKTVVAAAVATMLAGAGAAVAADMSWEELDKKTDWTYINQTEDGQVDELQGLIVLQKNELKAGETLKVIGYEAASTVNGLNEPTSEKIVNNGLIFVEANEITETGIAGMTASYNLDAEAINNGEIYVKGVGSAQVVGLGGNKGDTLVNNQLIKVEGENTYGILIWPEGQETSQKTTITNAGTVIASGEGATAVRFGVTTGENVLTNKGSIIAQDDAVAVSIGHATFNMEAGSNVDGLIKAENTTFNFNGNEDTLTVKATDSNINVQNGANITLADRQGSTYESVNIADGKLTASIWHDATEYGDKKEQLQNDNKFKNVTVGEKGVFNITKLNSGGSTDQTSAEAKPHTQLLIKDMNLTLAGGDLQVAGKTYSDKIVIGTSNTTDTLTITAGSYKFADVNFGSGFKSGQASKLQINGGELTVGTLDFSNGAVTVGGQLNADKLVWEDKKYGKDEVSSKAVGSLTVNEDGVLTTVAKDNLAQQDEKGNWSETEAGKHLTNNGTLELTDVFSAKAEDVKGYLTSAKDAFGGDVVFKNVTLTDEELAWDADLGMAGLNNVVTAPAPAEDADGKVTIAAGAEGTTVAVAGIEVAEGTKALSITGQGEVLLRGDTASGKVFEGTEALDALDVAGDLTLGYEASNKGIVNAKTVKVAGALDVAGDFTAQNVEVGSAYVDGALALNSLKVAETGTATVENGTLHLLGAAEDAAEITGKVNVTGTGLLTTNQAAASAYIAQLEDEEPSAVLYVDRAMKLADGAEIVIGTPTTRAIALLRAGDPVDPAPAAHATVKVQEGGYALVDVSNFIGTQEAVFGDNADVTVENAALDLINANKTGEVKLGASLNVTNGEIDTDSLYIGVDREKGYADGVVTLKYFGNIVANEKVDARLAALFAKGASAKEMAILNELQADKFIQEDADGHESFNALGNKAFEQATGGNATAGVLNVAYDANAQVTDAIVRHQLSDHAGMGVWADVFYAKNEAKKLYGDFGYSADIYGGVLGFDYTAACGGTLGAALTVGTADADSEGGVLSNSLSSDFVGFSVYASKDFSGLNVKADLGYIDFSNDFSGLGDASDASTITFGVRGDFTAYQNGAFSIAPHFGLRYTRIDTDAVAFNDEQTMNVLEAPVGVKFAGTFEATGWKLVPSYDFTIVPQLGDKDVEAFGTASDVTILSGGLFNNVLGVEAVKGNMSFGLNASYGFGPDDRANTQVNASFGYRF